MESMLLGISKDLIWKIGLRRGLVAPMIPLCVSYVVFFHDCGTRGE